MEPDVLAYLQSAEIFCVPEATLERVGFTRCVDNPAIPNHRYYEGYFHGLATPKPVPSMNPRKGGDMAKPAAPKQVRAFLKAFRDVNARWMRDCCDGKNESSQFLTQLLDNSCFFSDLAIQVHFGEPIAGKDIGWHRDGVNSILHMALSVRGERSLWYGDGDRDEVAPQKEGNVYITSPFALMHAVEYPPCTWDTRVVAVQCRLLMDDRDNNILEMCGESWYELMARLTPVLQAAPLRLPTLSEIHAAEKSL
jgi:hypothetical protein